MHRHCCDTIWLRRAGRLADRAAARVRVDPQRRDSLYNGEIGVALLAAELISPQPAGVPLYEPKAWPR
jgi:eukaryotic-like serine/threonine-protein kinase